MPIDEVSCPACESGHHSTKKANIMALEQIGVWITEIKISKNRSKRIFKKLAKRRATIASTMYANKPVMVSIPAGLIPPPD